MAIRSLIGTFDNSDDADAFCNLYKDRPPWTLLYAGGFSILFKGELLNFSMIIFVKEEESK